MFNESIGRETSIYLCNYSRIHFVDFTSAFKTVNLMKLVGKLSTLGLIMKFCNWKLNILTNRSQTAQMWLQTDWQSHLLHCSDQSPPQGFVFKFQTVIRICNMKKSIIFKSSATQCEHNPERHKGGKVLIQRFFFSRFLNSLTLKTYPYTWNHIDIISSEDFKGKKAFWQWRMLFWIKSHYFLKYPANRQTN